MKAKKLSSEHFMTRLFKYKNGWTLEVVGEKDIPLADNEVVRVRILDSNGKAMRPGKKGESQNWLIYALMYDFQWLSDSVWTSPSEVLWLHDELCIYGNRSWIHRFSEVVYEVYQKTRRLSA